MDVERIILCVEFLFSISQLAVCLVIGTAILAYLAGVAFVGTVFGVCLVFLSGPIAGRYFLVTQAQADYAAATDLRTRLTAGVLQHYKTIKTSAYS